jgi:Putative redox-active protein (C_GCAxxG_C_C)
MEIEERAAAPLAGGIMRGYQCGMVWGAALAVGAQAYRLFGAGCQSETEAVIATQKIVESFRALNKHINCREITGIDISSPTPRMIVRFLVKSGAKGSCFGMAARYAKAAFNVINSAFTEKQTEAPSAPVSCAALLAHKMGASDLHAVMAAGFAGGIGLSGGACGALGAAIWILGMNHLRAGAGAMGYKIPVIEETIERFLQRTHHEFECSKIAGRRFVDVGDHACYLREGGCAEIIDILAAQLSSYKEGFTNDSL